jgi:hypothetical protein
MEIAFAYLEVRARFLDITSATFFFKGYSISIPGIMKQ